MVTVHLNHFIRKAFPLSALCVASVILPSCDRDVSNECGRPVTIYPVAQPDTRAPIDGTSFPATRTMVVSAYFDSPHGADANYFSGKVFENNGSSWSCNSSILYWPINGALDLLAYSVGDIDISWTEYDTQNVADRVTVRIPDNSVSQSDIMYASSLACTYDPSGTPLIFRHAQALLVFTAKSNVPYDAQANHGITIEEIGVENAFFSGDLIIKANEDPQQGYCEWTNLGSRKGALPDDVGGVKLSDGASCELNYNVPDTAINVSSPDRHFGIGGVGLMVPEQEQTQISIKYTLHNGMDDEGARLDNKGLIYTYTCSGFWSEGRKYVYGISFSQSGINVSTSVTGWEGTDINFRTGDFYTAGTEEEREEEGIW